MLLPVLVGLGDEAAVSLAPDVGSDCYSVDEDCGFGSGGVPGWAEQPGPHPGTTAKSVNAADPRYGAVSRPAALHRKVTNCWRRDRTGWWRILR